MNLSSEEYTRNQLLESFLKEADEILISLNNILTELEASPQEYHLINELFRIFHSLKGTALFLEISSISDIAHALENILSLVRDGEMQIDNHLLKLFWEGAQLIDALITGIKGGDLLKNFKKKKTHLIKSINEIISENQKKYDEEVIQKVNKYNLQSYFYRNQDMSSEIVNIEYFLTNARKTFNQPDISRNFLKVLNGIVAKLYKLNAFEDVYLIKKMKNDYATLVADDGRMETFLIDFLQESFDKFKKKLELKQAMIASNPSGKLASENLLATIRIDEKNIDEIIDEMSKIAQRAELIKNAAREAHNHKSKQEAFLGNCMQTLDDLNNSVIRTSKKLLNMKHSTLHETVNNLKKLILNLAQSSNKKVEIIIEGEGIVVNKSSIEIIDKVLVHIVRNAVDHGLELPGERKKKGKCEQGRINIKIEKKQEYIYIRISDDGKGIDFSLIKKIALQQGLISQQESVRLTKKNITPLLFSPGITTALRVTEISGRGVGLDVVKKIIESAQGTIDVNGSMQNGTSFVIKLPLNNNHNSKAKIYAK